MTIKRLMLACVLVLCLVPLWGPAEEAAEWFDEPGELSNSLGEHFLYEIEDGRAVLLDYRVDQKYPQPARVQVPGMLGGAPLAVIGPNAFNNYGGSYDGMGVECIVIPENVTELGSESFQCAHYVERVELPSTLEKIDDYPFHHLRAEISFPNGNPYYRVEDGFLIDMRTDTLIYCCPSAEIQPLPGVKRIGDWALENYSPYQLTLEFPDGVVFIGACNAYDCVLLRTIIIPGSVEELADRALGLNTAEEIILNEGLHQIGAFAFDETETEEIAIPSTVQWIGYGAFSGWTGREAEAAGPDCVWETKEEYDARCRTAP